ncbi:MAG: hypothetical protein ACI4PE_03465 [Bacilli bacterium]
MDVVVYALCKKMISQGISVIGNIFTLKGSVSSKDNLPTTGNNNGDIYLVGPKTDGSYDEYYWIDPGRWELMGTTSTDLGECITINTLYAGEDGTGTIENPASNTILAIVNSKNRENFLAKDNEIEYTPTENYHPATKKYVDDIRAEIEKNNELEII